MEEERRELEDLESVLPNVRGALRPVAEKLLGFWWNVSDAVGEGWAHVVEQAPLNTDNIRGLREDADYRVELEALLERHANKSPVMDSWRHLYTATDLANKLGRQHVITFPGDPLTGELTALTSRYFTDIPTGGAIIGLLRPTRRLQIVGGGLVERGAWFDQLILGLGSAINLLDLQTVGELRHSGIASGLQRLIGEDLRQVAFAAERGADVDDALAEAKHRLKGVAEAADARVNATASHVTRNRLKQASIWGGNGLILGVLGGGALAGIASGGILLPTAILAGVGFALGAVGGAASATKTPTAGPDPVIFELLTHLRAKNRFGSQGQNLLAE